jgi:hypothetical protein
MFQVFQRYVVSVSYWYCKSRSGCCESSSGCCNGYARMFQVYVPNVLSVSDVCCKCFHLDVTKVDLNVAYICMLQVYVSSVSVLYIYCKCFIWILHMDVLKVDQMLHIDAFGKGLAAHPLLRCSFASLVLGAYLLAERVPSDANIPYQTSER